MQSRLQQLRRHLPERDQPLGRDHVGDVHGETDVVGQAAHELVGQKQHQERKPVAQEQASATQQHCAEAEGDHHHVGRDLDPEEHQEQDQRAVAEDAGDQQTSLRRPGDGPASASDSPPGSAPGASVEMSAIATQSTVRDRRRQTPGSAATRPALSAATKAPALDTFRSLPCTRATTDGRFRRPGRSDRRRQAVRVDLFADLRVQIAHRERDASARELRLDLAQRVGPRAVDVADGCAGDSKPAQRRVRPLHDVLDLRGEATAVRVVQARPEPVCKRAPRGPGMRARQATTGGVASAPERPGALEMRMCMEGLSPLHLVLVLVIAVLVLGPGKLPEVGAALGKTLREFRKATSDIAESAASMRRPPRRPRWRRHLRQPQLQHRRHLQTRHLQRPPPGLPAPTLACPRQRSNRRPRRHSVQRSMTTGRAGSRARLPTCRAGHAGRSHAERDPGQHGMGPREPGGQQAGPPSRRARLSHGGWTIARQPVGAAADRSGTAPGARGSRPGGMRHER